jgi:uncharacterized protein YyaL (SSP411 family)
MLYDNALLARAYLHGFQVTRRPAAAPRVRGDARVGPARPAPGRGRLRQSRSTRTPRGVEGKFYVWTLDEARAAAGELADDAIRHFGMTAEGNWEGVNVPVRATADPPELPRIKEALRVARERRVWPGIDDKRLTAWNALAISALAEAGAVLGRADFLDAARTAAAFLLAELVDGEGRVLRSYNRGQARLAGYLEDHAFLVEALLTLYEATFEEHWFVVARGLADRTIERFGDAERGGFFSTAHDHERLVTRRKDLEDTPIPSGQSAMALGLLRLGALTGESGYVEHALPVMRPLGEPVTRFPTAFGHLLQAMAFHLEPVREVAIVGDDPGPLLEVVRATYRPRTVLAGGAGPAVPLLEGREPVDGRTAAYVCEGFACRAPVTEPEALAALLE